METRVKIGDNVLISPDLTGFTQWEEGTVIEVESNIFNGIVIAAETKERNLPIIAQFIFHLAGDSQKKI